MAATWKIVGGIAAAAAAVGLLALVASGPSATKPGATTDPPDPDPEADPAPNPDPAPEPDPEFKENRVRVADFASLEKSDPRLKVLPETISYGGTRRVHHRVYDSLLALMAAAEAAGIPPLKVGSAWRPHRWKSKAEYEAKLIEKYGSVKEGRKWLAFASPHETGLAVDFRNSDLQAKSATAAKQKTTATYAWLKANAAKFGWTPYMREPWHWEQRITPAEFAS